MLNKEQILTHLKTVKTPNDTGDIIKAGMVSGVMIDENNHVTLTLNVNPEMGTKLESLRQETEQEIKKIKGVSSARVILTAEKPPQNTTRKKPQQIDNLLPAVKKIIAVASGKGGVGKSTIASNLATGLAQKGLKVGLLDADIYGPSMPTMMGAHDRPKLNDQQKIVPVFNHGVHFMSIGFMIDKEAPLIWRGPMVQTALLQLMRDVDWGELDVLIMDMPPGTGDVQLSTIQKVPLSGAIIVSTPQDIALIDARKALHMFQKMDVSILGLIENMSSFHCPNCGHESHIFDHGGAEKTAKDHNIPFLGHLPLDLFIREQSDQGKPFVLSDDDSLAQKSFGQFIHTIHDNIGK